MLSSLGVFQPGISVDDPDTTGTLTVQVVAGNTLASLSASSLGGATVSGTGNTLTITGQAAQVNAALASLELTETASASTDVLSISATDSTALPAQTTLAVDVMPATGPAFVAPPKIVTLQADSLTTLPSLVLSDPAAQGLADMGLGDEETLSLTLSVSEGILLLPQLGSLSPLDATGIGTGTIEITFTANEIAALNAVLADIEFAGPASEQHLDYTLWNLSGALPVEVTYGNIYLNTVGTAATNGTYVTAGQTVVTGDDTLTNTLSVTGIMSVLGNIDGDGAVMVAPDASLELPDNSMFLSGTSLNFGTMGAVTLVESGTLLEAADASFAGGVILNSGALLDFAGNFTADGDEQNDYDLAISLAQGAVLTGSGTLTVGNFSESGMISGPGTLLALGGETLEVDAGEVTGGADLEVEGGGVMVLGPLSPLYGIFDATALTIENSVTLSFGAEGAVPVSGGYADTLGGDGGAFVINGPQAFSGTILGFNVGDQLIFPGLSDFSVYNIGHNSFCVSGLDSEGVTESYTIFATIPTGLTPAAGVDAEGDPAVVLRSTVASVSTGGEYAATAGVAQKLLGLSLNLTGSTTQSLHLTLSCGHGGLNVGDSTSVAHLTLTASNLAALNAELANLTYTGTGVADVLTLTGSSGLLAGMTDLVPIAAVTTGTVDGYAGVAYSAAEMVSFGSAAGLPIITAPMAPGGVQVTGMVEFQGLIEAGGLTGTALTVDAGGQAIFGVAATVALNGDVAVGDTSGAGVLDVLTDAFSASGNILLGGNANAAVLGAVTAAGALEIGQAASASLALDGNISVSATTLDNAGTFFAYGTAQATLGSIANQGTIIFTDVAAGTASAYSGGGTLVLSGTADFTVAGQAQEASGGEIQIGSGATLDVATLTQFGGTVLDSGVLNISGTLYADGAGIALSGGTLIAATLMLGSTLSGYGVIEAPTIDSSGLIEASGGKLVLAGSVIATSLEVGPSAALELASGMSGGGLVSFAGGAALVTVDDVAAGFDGATNMVATDAIDLVGVAPDLVTYTGGTNGTVEIFDTFGNEVASFGIKVSGSQPAVSIVSDGYGGSLITLGDELPCFARGTGLLTPQGYRAVEELRPGDPVITAQGDRRPVRWVGWRTLDLGPASSRHARPVIVMPNAFGQGKPHKLLRLSPLHCVYADGVLIPVTHLVNHATILRDVAAPAATYFHVELDRHDILLAEGLECESYFDNGNRGALYRELGRRSPAPKPFAPSITTGARLAVVRRRLHEIALAAGFTTTYLPHVRAVAAGQGVTPEFSKAGRWRMARFNFPQPVRDITLLANAAAPADTDPDSADRRELGICLGEMRGVRLGAGWQPRAAGDEGVWMGRKAELRLTRARREILLPLAAVAQTWVRPMVDWRQVAG